MIVFRILLAVVCLFASCGSAFAAFPPTLQSCEASKPNNLPAIGSRVVGCGGYSSDGHGPFATEQISSTTCKGGASCGDAGVQASYFWPRKAVCAPNSTLDGGGMCVCNSGFTERNGSCVGPEQCVAPLVEVNGKCSCPAGTKEEIDANGLRQCKPDSLCSEMAGKPLGLPVTADYGSKSPSSLGRMIGNSSTTCFPGGCSVTGTVSGCWSAKGVAGCNLTDAKFTGDKCDDKAPPGGCPSGSSPSQYAAGVCVPDENKCPAGSSPSKYASGVCIPDENPCPAGQAPSKYAAGVCVPKDDPNADGNGETGNNSKCPPGRVESRYAAGVCIPADTTVGDGSGGGGGTTCKDGKCTTTNPDGSTDEKPEQEFCKENPDAPQCKKSNWGGSCGSFTCDGDAIQCAIAREQHQRNCKLFDEKTSHPAYQAAVDGTDEQSADKLKAKAEQITVDKTFNQAGFGWGTSCPLDPEIPLGFVDRSFTIPFSRICGPLEALSLAGVGITLLGCLVWVIGGKKA